MVQPYHYCVQFIWRNDEANQGNKTGSKEISSILLVMENESPTAPSQTEAIPRIGYQQVFLILLVSVSAGEATIMHTT